MICASARALTRRVVDLCECQLDILRVELDRGVRLEREAHVLGGARRQVAHSRGEGEIGQSRPFEPEGGVAEDVRDGPGERLEEPLILVRPKPSSWSGLNPHPGQA